MLSLPPLNSGPRKLAALLLAVVVPPAITLMWLGTRLLEQDRTMLAQRDIERRQAAAQAAVHALEQSLAHAELMLSQGTPPPGYVGITASTSAIQAHPSTSALWLPVARELKQSETNRFGDAEHSEFQGDSARALGVYQEFAKSSDAAISAGALLRVARIHRRHQRWAEALDAYRRLAAIRDVGIDGMPVDLIARRAICSVLEETGNVAALSTEANALHNDLVASRWQLDNVAWTVSATELKRWTRRPIPNESDRAAISSVAESLWDQWQRDPSWRRTGAGRLLVAAGGTHVTVLWRSVGHEISWLVIPPLELQRLAERALEIAPATVTLLAPSGHVLAGPPVAAERPVVKRDPSDTGLPWAVAVAARNESQLVREFATRRRLISVGLVAILLLLAGGSYFLWRVVQRDLAVARLQTDFVSTVSHEFRTPLASLRHITELLAERDDLPLERRRAFYDALARNSERLQHLVESLLDFARMEGGRKTYDFQPIDASGLAARVVADFRQVAPKDFTIDLEVDLPSSVELHADAASLTNALWNVLDNAVKYSPNGHAVHVSVHRHPAGIAISVSDAGLGIPREEQREIFGRFVRGKQARALGIQGTGLGLAMVSHIVRAHGGTIEVESQEGTGSTFRVVLPVKTVSPAETGHYVPL